MNAVSCSQNDSCSSNCAESVPANQITVGSQQVTDKLTAYLQQRFVAATAIESLNSAEIADSAEIETWRGYHRETAQRKAIDVLTEKLVQLQFPVEAKISGSLAYRLAVRRGVPTRNLAEASPITLHNPDGFQLFIHPSIAGDVPVITVANRIDFITLVQALTKRNEPVPIPNSMGACMIKGYNNWDRIRQHRATWEARHAEPTEAGWRLEYKQLLKNKAAYQDRFIILSNGPYSGVTASDLGLSPENWLTLSRAIRLTHECAHYFTERVFGEARRHLYDELIADYVGIVAANGRYNIDWALRFLGLDTFPTYRHGARLENYVEKSWLEAPLRSHLLTTIYRAVQTLGRFNQFVPDHPSRQQQRQLLLTIGRSSLADLAADDAVTQLLHTYRSFEEKHHAITI